MGLLDDNLTHAQLYNLRDGATPAQQAQLGPMEHQAFARQWTADNPYLAVPSLSAAIPLYTLAKLTGIINNTRSPASWNEVASGYSGIGQGLSDYYNDSMAKLASLLGTSDSGQ